MSGLALATAMVVAPSPASAAQVYPIPATGTFTVYGHGNGHGHGMSQYGANGAALQGLTAAQIVAFYYPGTTLAAMDPATPIRVQLSGVGTPGNPYTTVVAQPGLSVNGKAITAPGTMFRLVPPAGNDSSGLVVQALQNGAWNSVIWALGDTASFSTTAGYVRTQRIDGTSTDYWGTVGAAWTPTSPYYVVNTVGLDQYTQGVAPREVPASWPAAAVQAQAIAARTYGEYAREHPPANLPYDICDTSQCQVYGGKTHYAANGSVAWTDDPAAISGNQGQVLQYGGATIFAQFSASDGGWTTDGGKPYLIAQPDPYDNAASNDPYLNWSKTVSGSQLASYYGLSSVSQVVVTQRDGNGDWGGRVLSASVTGTNGAGAQVQVNTTGYGLQSAMGLFTNWFTFSTYNTSGYVSAVYPVLLGRSVDPGGLATWMSYLNGGGSPAGFTQAVTMSAEGRGYLISSYYQAYLGRAADPGGLSTWRSALAGGASPLDVQVAILASAEYWGHAGGTNTSFVDSLYTNPLILNRSPDPGGEANWVNALNSGASRAAVASGFLTSGEAVSKRVSAAYQLVLARGADPGGLSAWSPYYRAVEYDIGQLDAVLAASGEYLAKFQ